MDVVSWNMLAAWMEIYGPLYHYTAIYWNAMAWNTPWDGTAVVWKHDVLETLRHGNTMARKTRCHGTGNSIALDGFSHRNAVSRNTRLATETRDPMDTRLHEHAMAWNSLTCGIRRWGATHVKRDGIAGLFVGIHGTQTWVGRSRGKKC